MKIGRVVVLLILSVILIFSLCLCGCDDKKVGPTNISPTLNKGIDNQGDPKKKLSALKNAFRNHVKRTDDFLTFYRSSANDLKLETLGIKPDTVIADLGCGTGAFEMVLLDEKIPFTKLYATDIDKPSLDFLRFVLNETKMPGNEKVEIILSEVDDAKLPPKSVDIFLSLNTKIGLRTVKRPLNKQGIDANQRLFNTIKASMRDSAVFHAFEPIGEYSNHNYQEKWVVDQIVSYGFRVISKERIKLGESYYHVVFAKDDMMK